MPTFLHDYLRTGTVVSHTLLFLSSFLLDEVLPAADGLPRLPPFPLLALLLAGVAVGEGAAFPAPAGVAGENVVGGTCDRKNESYHVSML